MIALTVAATLTYMAQSSSTNTRRQEKSESSVLLAQLSAPSPAAGTPTAIRKERVQRAAANGAALATRLRGGFTASTSAGRSSRRSSSAILQVSTQVQFPKLSPSPMSRKLHTYVTDNGSGGTDVYSSMVAGSPMCAGRSQCAKCKAARTSGMNMVAFRPKGYGVPPQLAALLDELSVAEAQLGASESESFARRYSRRLLLVLCWLLA